MVNYFVWRQQDAVRNSIQMVGQAFFSQKQLHGKSCNEIQEMLFRERGINWSRHYPIDKKRGIAVRKVPITVETQHGTSRRMKFEIDWKMPELTKDRSYIGDLLATDEE